MSDFVSKRYDPESGRFIVEKFDEEDGWSDWSFDDFDAFLKACDYDLSDAKLNGYKPKPKDMVLCIRAPEPPSTKSVDELMKSAKHKLAPKKRMTVFYITDIHLDSKISRRYPEGTTQEQRSVFIDEIVQRIADDFLVEDGNDHVLLVGGDVSHDCHIVEEFYTLLAERVGGQRVVAILGNHEFWDVETHKAGGHPCNSAIEWYSGMAERIGIHLLEGNLIVFNDNGFEVVKRQYMRSFPDEGFKRLIRDSRLAVFGGTGFAGLNNTYNADSGMYREGVDRDEEISLSKNMDCMYRRLLSAAQNFDMVVLSHMSLKDWTEAPRNPNWIYVHGHDHRNRITIDKMTVELADNQIGYGGTVGLKSFHPMANDDFYYQYDALGYYPDGIHEITKAQMFDFYRTRHVNITCSQIGTFYMVKREGLYMFFVHLPRGSFYMLSGGMVRNCKTTDLHYYFDRLSEYAECVRRFTAGHRRLMNQVSTKVTKLGGWGTTHGCIVDIDFYNHIYVNPMDGKLTPYNAPEDIVNKYVYPSVRCLIQEQCPKLLQKYEENVVKDLALVQLFPEAEGEPVLYTSTDIYTASRIYRSMQYLVDKGIVRRWDEVLFKIKETDDMQAMARLLLVGKTPDDVKEDGEL